MQTFDASSIIYAWDNYPEDQFPPLWDWIAPEIERDNFSIPSVAFDEVKQKTPDCGQWLKDNGIRRLPVTNDVAQEAMRIKSLLGIEEDGYKQGVNENDLLIIATAGIKGFGLVSNEAKQTTPPDIPAKRKIPAMCADPQVDVKCIDFLELIKQSDEVFG